MRKTYIVVAVAAMLVFVGGFYLLYYSFSSKLITKDNESVILNQLDEQVKNQVITKNNAEFEERALPLNEDLSKSL